MFGKQDQQWEVAHLATEEPEAAHYLHAEWDDSTLVSTPSIKQGCSPRTTILRDCGEPSEIIISIERRLSISKRLLKKILRALRLLMVHFFANKNSSSSAASTTDPSLGVNGVLV